MHRGDALRRLALVAAIGALLAQAPAAPASAAGDDRVTLTGTVRMTISDDFATGRSHATYGLETVDGRVPLVVAGGGGPGVSGAGATVTGIRLRDGSIRVEGITPGPAAAGAATGDAARDAAPVAPVAAAAAWPGPSVRRVALILGVYADMPGAVTTPSLAREAIQGAGATVKSFFETASRGRVTIEATVYGPWNLGIDSCAALDTFSATATAVTQQAAAHGVSLATFDHVIMWTKPPCGSGWVAMGDAPGQFIHMSAAYPDDASGREHEFAATAAHEMGHNLGLLHANSLPCTGAAAAPVTLSATCDGIEYGDPYSTMGGDLGYWDPAANGGAGGYRFLSPLYDSAELDHLGWLGGGETRAVTAAGSYGLVPTYGAAPGVRLLRVRRTPAVMATDPATGWPLRSGWWTVEMRGPSPDGTWDALPDGSPGRTGLIVRYVEDGYDFSGAGFAPDNGTTFLPDMHPLTVGTDAADEDILDSPLPVGATFTDPVAGGPAITLRSLDAGGATIDVAFPSGGPAAAAAMGAPTITRTTPGTGQVSVGWNAPPTAASYPPEGYTVRSYPGAATCSILTSWRGPLACTVTGLATWTAYRFTVTAETHGGFWATSAPSAPLTLLGVPTASIATLATWRATASIPVSWSGTDHGGPVDSFDVRYRSAPWNGTFGGFTTWRSATRLKAATLAGKGGRTYCFSARTRAGGRVSAWTGETCTAVPIDDRSLARSSHWTALTGASYFRSTALRTTRSGSSLRRTGVVARRIGLVVSTCPTCGSVKVYWNGAYRRTISLHSATVRNRVMVTATTFSSVRAGTLRLVVSGSSRRVTVDGVAVNRR